MMTLPKVIASKIVVSESDCWMWKGTISDGGYAHVVWTGSPNTRRVHRIVYQLLVGPIPSGLTLDHLCRVKSCVNPSHLEPVTMKENNLRSMSLSAINARKTHCIRGHDLNNPDLVYRRRGWRDCTICRLLRQDRIRHEQGENR
jgi:hypothetical protein